MAQAMGMRHKREHFQAPPGAASGWGRTNTPSTLMSPLTGLGNVRFEGSFSHGCRRGLEDVARSAGFATTTALRLTLMRLRRGPQDDARLAGFLPPPDLKLALMDRGPWLLKRGVGHNTYRQEIVAPIPNFSSAGWQSVGFSKGDGCGIASLPRGGTLPGEVCIDR